MKNGKRIICVIPARMGSYRFKDKPFVDICGKPMIEHVYRRAAMCPILDGVYVATPNREIMKRVETFGGEAIMTSDSHRRASERVAEAARLLGGDADIVVNLQGDEPLVNPDMIERAVDPLIEDPSIPCVNLARKAGRAEAEDKNAVKVVFDRGWDALYFSREPIPSKWMGDKQFEVWVEVCVMPFTRDSLQLYTQLEMTPLEHIESIDMLRWLEHGRRVRIVESPYETYSVDVPEEVGKVARVMRSDPLLAQYA